MVSVVDPKQDTRLWGRCKRCGHTLLVEDFYCPSCGAQRDWSEIVR